MPNHLFFPLMSLGLFVPLIGSFIIWKLTNIEQARR